MYDFFGFFPVLFPMIVFPDTTLLNYCINEEQNFLILGCDKLLQY